MKYKEWLEKWLKNDVGASAKQRTCARYLEIIRVHIVPKLGDIEITTLTLFILQNYVTELINSGNIKTGKALSSSTVNSIITVIQNSLKIAYMLNYISSYTADKIKRPKVSERKIECYLTNRQ